ncbi:hypothetical protein IQ231_03725 [Cuspidothrix issatschenkoi LEGE 03284]|nr:hypothetical protein [Cuspidothrix issatschenkoi LEGE 03284]
MKIDIEAIAHCFNQFLTLDHFFVKLHIIHPPASPSPLTKLSITDIFLNIKFDKRKHLWSETQRQKKSAVTLVEEYEKKDNFKKPHFLELMSDKNQNKGIDEVMIN